MFGYRTKKNMGGLLVFSTFTIVKIIETNDDSLKLSAVVNDQHLEFEVDKRDFEITEVHPSCIEGVDDLLMLGDFNEPTLLQNTRARYYKDGIYSFIGSPILIAVNPYKKLFTDEKKLIKEFKEYFKRVKLEVISPDS
jgi:myosin heavy subunit